MAILNDNAPTEEHTAEPTYPYNGVKLENGDEGVDVERQRTEKDVQPESDGTLQVTGPQKTEQDDQPHEYPSGWKLGLITIALCLVVLCMALDNTIIATAIPRISDEFHALNDVGWYASAYLLTTCSFQLFFGKLYTFYSIKKVFLSAIAIFEIGSLICGAAPTSTALIIGRAVAGAGSAGLFSGAVLIVANAVPLQKRPMYTGVISAMFGIASVGGPLMGGVFTDKLTWRWCFYINLPLGGVTLLFIIFFFASPVKISKATTTWKEKISQFDMEGSACFLPGIISILLGLQWGGTVYAWSNWRIILLLVFFGTLILGFIGVQYWKQEKATVPPRILMHRSVWGSAAFSFCLGSSFFLMMYYVGPPGSNPSSPQYTNFLQVPIWFQAIKGVTAVESGIMCLPMVLSMVVSAMCAGGGVSYLGYFKPFMYASVVIMSIGAGLMTTMGVDAGQDKWIGYQFMYGFGAGLGMQQPIIAIQASLPLADIPIATSIFMFSQTLGGAIFVSVAQNIFANRLIANLGLTAGLDPALVLSLGATGFRRAVPPELVPGVLVAYNDAVRQAWYVATGTCAAAILGALAIKWGSVKGKVTGPPVAT